ncbi:MAG: alpha/beta fold hydrolase [Candidatus Hydrogenedentes bacterium]|nr:alpha/beta fold hydrolase [Candidatus Hydrogenedentota bacterium]
MLAFGLFSCHKSAGPAQTRRDVSITTADGVSMAATLYPAGPGAPGLVLVHALGSTRLAWDHFALKAQQAGYSVLAFDIRGHGQSTSQNRSQITYRNFTTEDWLGALNDIDAARTFLINSGADPTNTAIVGASIGANLALNYAVKTPGVPAIVMISPGLDYKGVTTRAKLVELGERPVLLMTSTGDSYSAASCSTLKQVAPGHCELREYAGTAHGTDLLDAAPAAIEQIFVWLKPIIGPQTKNEQKTGTGSLSSAV